MGDQDALPGIQLEAKGLAMLVDIVEEFVQQVEVADGIPIVSKPNMDQLRELFLQVTDQGDNCEATKDHCQGVALCHSFHAVENKEGARAGVHNESGPVAVAVEDKVKAHCPLMAHHPNHQHPAELIEGVDGIKHEGTKLRFVSHFFPELCGSMDAPLNA